jgi:1-acyl-sn-glycerol-3-phosphate acyltransferase
MHLTIVAFSYVIFSMIFLAPFAFVALIFYGLGIRRPMIQVIYRIAQFWGIAILKLTKCDVTVTGRENIPYDKRGICFVSNHDGYFDIVLLMTYCNRPIGFVAKKELAFVPFLNIWIYMLGGPFIDRKNARKAVKAINKGVKRLKSGRGLIIFPEGHRSKGAGLQPFHPGALKLATMADVPIVPVAIKGTADIWEKAGKVVSASLKIHFCEPVETAGLSPAEKKVALSDKIHGIIGERLEKL